MEKTARRRELVIGLVGDEVPRGSVARHTGGCFSLRQARLTH